MISSLEDAVDLLNMFYVKKDFNSAIKVYKIAIELAKANKASNDIRTLKKMFGLAAEVYAEIDDNTNSLNTYKHYHCLFMQLRSSVVPSENIPSSINLFQFRKITNYTLSNLLKREITLTHPSQMNDIVDSLIFSWFDSPSFGANAIHKKHLPLLKESYNDYRIACFCEDQDKNQKAIQNTLMWSHYADNHAGICIEYSFDIDDFGRNDFNANSVSRFFKVKYIDAQLCPINFETDGGVTLSPEKAFFTKSNDWEYENEVRLLQYSANNGALRTQYKLSNKSKIVAIYFGWRCSDENIRIIQKLLADTDIRYFKMHIDFSNVHKLKYIPC